MTAMLRLCISIELWSCDYSLWCWCCCCSQSTKAVYNRILDLKIATPQIVINYGLFLEEHNYFEEAFKVSLLMKVWFVGLSQMTY